MPNWLKTYHRLPYPLRVLAASARGYYLRWWRYGPETEQLVEEVLDRETWSLNRWQAWQEDRLAFILHRAATKVPYYRDRWLHRRRHGDRRSWEVLENWPVLKKGILRDNARAFLAEDCSIHRMFRESTSGTTGTPLSIYFNGGALRLWYALFEARLRRWHGVSIKDRWAIMGGQLVVPFEQTKPPFWVYNAGLNQLYLSTHHLCANHAKAYVDALRDYSPTHMLVYPSSAYILAAISLDQGMVLPQLKVVLSNAEFLSDAHRETIRRAFRCPVRNTYGMAEAVAAASECEKGSMHIWPEQGMIEVFEDTEDVPVTDGEVGRFITTGLLNPDMPLIRYEVGDRGRLDLSSRVCSCERALPLLSSIEGRLNDLILSPDGRRIFWLNPVFYGLPVLEAQIIQESLDRIRVRFVPAPGYSIQDGMTVIQRLHGRVGKMETVLDPVDHIPREATGKFRAVISRISLPNRESG